MYTYTHLTLCSQSEKSMNFKEIIATAVGVALGVFLAGVLTSALQKMQDKNNFENDNA